MATNITVSPIDLYIADTAESVIQRQNNKYTHSFTIPITEVGTALILIRSDSYITEEELKAKIIAGNNVDDDSRYPFDLMYYQLLASCSLSNTINSTNAENLNPYDGTLAVSYRTTITASSTAPKTPETELFVANSLLSRASRQTGRTSESIRTEVLNVVDDQRSQFVYLILVAAKKNEVNQPYIFTNDESWDSVSIPEKGESAVIADFLSEANDDKPITMARVLGYFPKDQPDFHKFMQNGYTIQVIGNCNLTIAKHTNS